MIDPEQIWRGMAATDTTGAGLLRRRLAESTGRDIYLGMHTPAGLPMLIVRAPADAVAAAPKVRSTRAVEWDVVPVDEATTEVRMTLTAAEMRPVFGPFVADVAEAVGAAPDDAAAVGVMAERYLRWRRMFAGTGGAGLSRAEAQGLWSELWVLRHVLLDEWGSGAVAAWTGVNSDDKDFRLETVELEVKSTEADQPLGIRINGADQLEASPGATLLLAVLEVDAHDGGVGQSLPDMVAAVRAAVGAPELQQLETALAAAGYSDADRDLYERRVYSLRSLRWFEIGDGFPRILPTDCMEGVGGVAYTVAVDACTPWRIGDERCREVLMGAKRR